MTNRVVYPRVIYLRCHKPIIIIVGGSLVLFWSVQNYTIFDRYGRGLDEVYRRVWEKLVSRFIHKGPFCPTLDLVTVCPVREKLDYSSTPTLDRRLIGLIGLSILFKLSGEESVKVSKVPSFFLFCVSLLSFYPLRPWRTLFPLLESQKNGVPNASLSRRCTEDVNECRFFKND